MQGGMYSAESSAHSVRPLGLVKKTLRTKLVFVARKKIYSLHSFNSFQREGQDVCAPGDPSFFLDEGASALGLGRRGPRQCSPRKAIAGLPLEDPFLEGVTESLAVSGPLEEDACCALPPCGRSESRGEGPSVANTSTPNEE